MVHYLDKKLSSHKAYQLTVYTCKRENAWLLWDQPRATERLRFNLTAAARAFPLQGNQYLHSLSCLFSFLVGGLQDWPTARGLCGTQRRSLLERAPCVGSVWKLWAEEDRIFPSRHRLGAWVVCLVLVPFLQMESPWLYLCRKPCSQCCVVWLKAGGKETWPDEHFLSPVCTPRSGAMRLNSGFWGQCSVSSGLCRGRSGTDSASLAVTPLYLWAPCSSGS